MISVIIFHQVPTYFQNDALITGQPVSPFGRDLKGTFAALQSLLRTKAINFTLRLATIPFRSRRNIIDLIRGALEVRYDNYMVHMIL